MRKLEPGEELRRGDTLGHRGAFRPNAFELFLWELQGLPSRIFYAITRWLFPPRWP